MSTDREREQRKFGFQDGIRVAIAWLHKRADEMNDPRARQVLNSAAFSLGADKRRAALDPQDATDSKE